MLDWQKKKIIELKKLPDFDDHPFSEAYGDESDETDIESDDSKNENGDSEGNAENKDDGGEEEDKSSKANAHAKGAGGDGGVDPANLKVITNETFEQNKEQLLDGHTSYNYFNLQKLI